MAAVVLFQFCGLVVLSCSGSLERRVGRLRWLLCFGCFRLLWWLCLCSGAIL